MPTISGWLKPPIAPTVYVVRGRLYALTQHYSPKLRASCACLSPDHCRLCEAGMPLQRLRVLPISEPQSERIWLLRILPSQPHVIDMFHSPREEQIGRLIEITRLAANEGNRLALRLLGRQAATAAPVDKYIAAIGRKAYSMLSDRMEADLANLLT